MVETETTELNMASSICVNALERLLPQHGYRTVRSFDLHLDQDTPTHISQVGQPCQCGCDYTVLLVFANTPQAGLEGTISVRGIAARTIVSLIAPKVDGEFVARFATILVEAIQMKNSAGGESCCYAHA